MAVNLTCINGTNVSCTTGNCTPCATPIVEGAFSIFAKIRIIIYVIAFVLSLFGNGSVMLVALKRFRSRAPVPAFFALLTHLAFADFLFSCNAFILIPNEIHAQEREDSLAMCSFKKLFRQTPFMVAIGTILVIAVERYLGITSTISRKWTYKRVLVSLIFVWIFSFLIYIPNIYVIKVNAAGVNCQESWSAQSRRIYAVVLLFAEYIIPLAVIAFCNYKIIKVIRQRRKFHIATSGVRMTEQQEEDQKKTVRILIAVVLGFAILCLPNQIFYFYLEFSSTRFPTGSTWDILQMFGVLLLLHTSFNPAVYSIMDRKFREEAKAVCCCCCCKKGRKRSSTKDSSSGLKTTRTASELNNHVNMKRLEEN